MNTRIVLPENQQMTRQDFYRLCHRLRDYEYQLAHLDKPDRGVKSKVKKVRQELRIILTPRQLAQLTTRTRRLNQTQYTLYVGEFDDEDFGEEWYKKLEADQKQKWGYLQASLYNSTCVIPEA